MDDQESCALTKTSIWIVTLLYMSSLMSTQVIFYEEPGPHPVLLPVRGHIVFNCSVNSEAQILRWRAYIPSFNSELFTDSSTDEISLSLLGITVSKNGPHSSQLIVNATFENLLTYAVCEARIDGNDSTRTRRGVNVTVYGPPSTPTQLSLRTDGNLLIVNWTSSAIQSIALWFDLVLTSLKTTYSTQVRVNDTRQHQFSLNGSRNICDVFKVRVIANNDAGASSPAVINGSFPALPEINLFQHSLSKSSGSGVRLTVTIMILRRCPVNPVTHYTLEVILGDSVVNTTEQKATLSPTLVLQVDNLMENATYLYRIVATNEIGRETTSSTEFLTTDIQGVSVCLVEGSTYSIQCSYIDGSFVSGCGYVLVSMVEGAINVSGTIDGRKSIIQNISNIEEYSTVLVDDGNSTFIINNTFNSNAIESCITTTEFVYSSSEVTTPTLSTTVQMSTTYIYVIIGLIGLALCILVPTIVIIAILYRCGYFPTMRKERKSHIVNRSITDPNDSENTKGECQDKNILDGGTGSVDVTAVELPDPLYNILCTNNCKKEATTLQNKQGNEDTSGNYSQLNNIPIYHVLESEASRSDQRISVDPNAPPLPADYCPSGGDTPPPQLEQTKSELAGDVFYAEVGTRSAAKR